MGKLKKLTLATITSALFAANIVTGQSSIEQSRDTINIGFAHEGYQAIDVAKAIDNVNGRLAQDNLYIEVDEMPRIMTKPYKSRELNHLIKNSFRKPHDIYIAWSKNHQPNKKFATESQYDKRVSFIDGSISKEQITDVLYYEIAKHLQTKGENPMIHSFQHYTKKRQEQAKKIYSQAYKKKQVAKLHKQQEKVSTRNHKPAKEQQLTYTLVLHDFDTSRAQEIMKEVEELYSSELNIKYTLNDIIPYTKADMKSEKALDRFAKRKSKSDTYIALTSHDWETRKTTPGFNTVGAYAAETDLVWIEEKANEAKNRSTKEMAGIIAHEIGHSMNADHHLLPNYTMSAINTENSLQFTQKTKIAIYNHIYNNTGKK